MRLPFKTTLGNGTIVGEVLQCRCKNVCIGDIICQNAGERFLEKKQKWHWISQEFRPLAIPASGTYPHTSDVAVKTEGSLVERTANDKSVPTSRKNPSTSATLALPDMSVEKN